MIRKETSRKVSHAIFINCSNSLEGMARMVKQKAKNKKVLGGFYIFFEEELVKGIEELFQELHISD